MVTSFHCANAICMSSHVMLLYLDMPGGSVELGIRVCVCLVMQWQLLSALPRAATEQSLSSQPQPLLPLKQQMPTQQLQDWRWLQQPQIVWSRE
jgi:hypothetical protein